jgi:hypothetical protein
MKNKAKVKRRLKSPRTYNQNNIRDTTKTTLEVAIHRYLESLELIDQLFKQKHKKPRMFSFWKTQN